MTFDLLPVRIVRGKKGLEMLTAAIASFCLLERIPYFLSIYMDI